MEKALIPPDALREILVNALIHRDYTIAGGSVALAIFDDRVEVWSAGKYPRGITPEMLSRPHLSVQRNPIIAEVFFRAGLIEKWGSGTNRVAEMCLAHGIAAPEFEEIGPAAVVTFRVPVAVVPTGVVTPQVTPQVAALLRLLSSRSPTSGSEIRAALELKDRMHFQRAYIMAALAAGFIEMTLPGKPNSRMQKYQLTALGKLAAGRSEVIASGMGEGDG